MDFTNFLLLDKDGDQADADASGPNVAFNSHESHSTECRGCGEKYFLDVCDHTEKLYILRLIELLPLRIPSDGWKRALPVALVASGDLALDCFSTPQEQIAPDKELVDRTKTIVLATAVKAELTDKGQNPVRFHFRIIRTLKGSPPENLTIDGDSAAYGNPLDDFDGHRKASFWEGDGGRSWHHSDCAIHPTFAVGGTFLIFLDQPYHRKSFEMILRSPDAKPEDQDQWLKWVESHLGSAQPK